MQTADPYSGREQTRAKHFILKRYLEGLAFKVLTFSDLTFVDGFCGPWKTRTEDFRDSSFMIAINVLKDAQRKICERDGKRRTIRLFFSELDPDAFAQLTSAAGPFNRPEERFEIRTHHGKFEDAVDQIDEFVGRSMPLIFLDPTGWTGYPLEKIKPLFARPKCEVLINFMYEFINRFVNSDDPDTIGSLDQILGGPGWHDRLDPKLSRGAAAHELFEQTLKEAGRFRFVVSTPIDKATSDRPHFYITYATKSLDGLKEFRETQHRAMREHARNRALAREQLRDLMSGTPDFFAEHKADVEELAVSEFVDAQKTTASAHLLDVLARESPLKFTNVVLRLIQRYALRETNVKDICVSLAEAGKIDNTWGGGNRKPQDMHEIRLMKQR